jgi:hypothetical protein
MKNEELEKVITLAEKISSDIKNKEFAIEKIKLKLLCVFFIQLMIGLFYIFSMFSNNSNHEWYTHAFSLFFFIFTVSIFSKSTDRKHSYEDDNKLDLPRLNELIEMTNSGLKETNKEEFSNVAIKIFELRLSRIQKIKQ